MICVLVIFQATPTEVFTRLDPPSHCYCYDSCPSFALSDHLCRPWPSPDLISQISPSTWRSIGQPCPKYLFSDLISEFRRTGNQNFILRRAVSLYKPKSAEFRANMAPARQKERRGAENSEETAQPACHHEMQVGWISLDTPRQPNHHIHKTLVCLFLH